MKVKLIFFFSVLSLFAVYLMYSSNDNATLSSKENRLDLEKPHEEKINYLYSDKIDKGKVVEKANISTEPPIKNIELPNVEKILNFSKKEEIDFFKNEISLFLNKPAENRHLSDLDLIILSIFESVNLSREDTVLILWDVVNNSSINDVEFGYFIDTLSGLKPLELTSEITIFYENSNNTRKIKIIQLLSQIVDISNIEDFGESELIFIANKHEEINDFLHSMLLSTSDKKLFRELIFTYSYSAPSEEFESFFQSFPKENILSLMSEEDYNSILINTSLYNKNSQSIELATVISSDNLAKPNFLNKLTHQISFGAEGINQNNKDLILKELKSKPLEVVNKSSFSIDDVGFFINKLNALVELENHNYDNKSAYFSEYSINNFLYKNKIFEMAVVINLSEPEVFSLFQARKNEILPFLEDEISNENVSNSEKTMIYGAIEALSE